MAKNLYFKRCGTNKPRDSLLSSRYIIVFGLLISVVTVSWLFWSKSELPVQLKSFTRNKVIRPIRLAPVQEVMRMSLHDTKGDGLQATMVTSAQEAINSTPKNDYAKEQNESEGNYVVKGSISRSHSRGFVIQVGAFRSRVRAEKLQKELQDKGYDAYLETRALPNHEPFHRVRIRGYMSLVDARAEMEHLLKEEGLESFALPMESNLP